MVRDEARSEEERYGQYRSLFGRETESTGDPI
jgi:hypothetical protein